VIFLNPCHSLCLIGTVGLERVVILVVVFAGSCDSWICTVLAVCPYAILRFAILVVWFVLWGSKGSLSLLPLLQGVEVHEPAQCWLKVQSPHRRPLISFRINYRLLDTLVCCFHFLSPICGRPTLLCSLLG